jgi:hypothetical protein
MFSPTWRHQVIAEVSMPKRKKNPVKADHRVGKYTLYSGLWISQDTKLVCTHNKKYCCSLNYSVTVLFVGNTFSFSLPAF